jgi:hypothetical protein
MRSHPEAVPVEERQQPEGEHPGERGEPRPAGRAAEERLGREEGDEREEELHLAREVPRDDGLRRERAAARLHRPEPQAALPGRLPLPGELEEREVEGPDEEDREERGREDDVRLERAARREDPERDHEREHDRDDEHEVEQERAEPVAGERDGEPDRDALGRDDLARALRGRGGRLHGRSLPEVARYEKRTPAVPNATA